MTCIGNSGPLPDEVVRAIEEKDLVAVGVLSGNRCVILSQHLVEMVILYR